MLVAAFPRMPEWEKLLRANHRATSLKMGQKTKLQGAQEVGRPTEKKCFRLPRSTGVPFIVNEPYEVKNKVHPWSGTTPTPSHCLKCF